MNAIGPIELIIIGVVVITILFMFRKRLRTVIFQIGKDSRRSERHAGDVPPPGGVTISGNAQAGPGRRIDVARGDTAVRGNAQTGREQEIVVGPEGAAAGPPPAGLDEIPPDQAQRARLRQFLAAYFDEVDLRDLCFDFGFEYDSLPHSGTRNKTREIVKYLAHRNRLDELETYGRQQRPGAPW